MRFVTVVTAGLLLAVSGLGAMVREEVVPFGELYAAEALVERPSTVAEVQAIVRRARAEGGTVSIAGAQRSQGGQVLPVSRDGILLSMENLRAIRVDPTQKVAHVQPGALWLEVQDAVNPHALAVRVMQASNIFSVGGSIGTNVHGWDHISGALANTINSLTIVDEEGELRHLRPKDPRFGDICGGFGLFGIVVEAELSLTDNVSLRQWGEAVSPDQYGSYFRDKIAPNHNIQLHLYRLSIDPKTLLQEGVAISFEMDSDYPIVSRLGVEPAHGKFCHRIALHAACKSDCLRGVYWRTARRSALRSTLTTRNEAMRPPINAMFGYKQPGRAYWLQEYFVAPGDLADFLSMLRPILVDNDVVLLNATVRFVKQQQITHLGCADQDDRFAVVLFFEQQLDSSHVQQTEQWVGQIVDYLAEHGGTFYLPYQHFATREQFHSCYPTAAAFNDRRPALFASQFSKHYFG